MHGRYTARFRYLCTHSFLATVLIPLGSCNGLQHYAALGLDAKGGAQVNLVPSSKPQDVYSGVCDVVKAKVRLPPRSIVCNGLHVLSHGIWPASHVSTCPIAGFGFDA